MTKVLIVDDHEVVTIGVKNKIRNYSDLFTVMDSSTVPDALSYLSENECDVVITDLQFDKIKSFEIPEYCSANGISCIVYSSYENHIFVKRIQDLKGVSYVSKSSDIEYLVAAIEYALKGGVYFCPRIKAVIDYALPDEIFEPELSEKETRIMHLFAKGLSIKEVAAEANISYETLITHRKRMTYRNKCNFDQLLYAFREWNSL